MPLARRGAVQAGTPHDGADEGHECECPLSNEGGSSRYTDKALHELNRLDIKRVLMLDKLITQDSIHINFHLQADNNQIEACVKTVIDVRIKNGVHRSEHMWIMIGRHGCKIGTSIR